MKKLITLLLAMAGMVSTASAYDSNSFKVKGVSGLTGSDWTENKLTDEDEDGIYTFTTTQSLTANTSYEYKYGFDDDWNIANNSNRSFSVQASGTYKITFSVDLAHANSYDDKSYACDTYAVLKPTTVMFVGKGITSDDWASTETGFTAEGDSWTFTIDQTQNNNVYFRFKIDGTEYCPNNNSNRWFNSSDGWTMNMNAWSTYQGTNGCFALSSFNYLNVSRYIVKITPYSNNIFMEVSAYEKATTNSFGYCTFVNNFPLNISGATAYYATDKGNGSATAVKMTNPVANTPMLIKGDNSTTYYFAVAATGADDPDTGNAFKAGDGTAPGSGDDASGYNYILNNDAFYLAADWTVPSNKAYLHLTQKSLARALIFDDEATAINTVVSKETTDQNYYNLSGQRIVSPAKGLYIRDGKKVIMK